MLPNEGKVPPREFWTAVCERFVGRYLGFRTESATPPRAARKAPPPASLVGSWSGRTWEVAFREPRPFYPDTQVGFTTAVRLVEPPQMPFEPAPWLFVGERPRVFSKNAIDFDRIIMRYRRREGNFKGSMTGDAQLDRRWAVYPFDEALEPGFREEPVRKILRSFETVSPNPKNTIPALAVFGTEATLTLPVLPTRDRIPHVMDSFEGLGYILDRIEEARGGVAARVRPIPMDLVHDETGAPFPVPRFDCPVCGRTTHPRYQANLETEVCEVCGKMLYRWK